MDPTNNISCPQFIHALTFLANDFTSSVLSSVYKTSCPILFLSWMVRGWGGEGVRREPPWTALPSLPTCQHLCSETGLSQINCPNYISVCHIHSPTNDTLPASFPLLLHLLFSLWLLLLACKLDMLAPIFILFSHLIKICPHVVLSIQPTSLSFQVKFLKTLVYVWWLPQFSHFLFERSNQVIISIMPQKLISDLHMTNPKMHFLVSSYLNYKQHALQTVYPSFLLETLPSFG